LQLELFLRAPTADEYTAVRNGGDAALRATMRSYMSGKTFGAFLTDHAMTRFLTLRANPFTAISDTEFPVRQALTPVERDRFFVSAQREPNEFVRYIVENELPWSEVVTADYSLVNGLLARVYAARVEHPFTDPADLDEWQKGVVAARPELNLAARDYAGVLSTAAYLSGYSTTPTNRNRHRISHVMRQFLATDISALAKQPAQGTSAFKIPTVQDPNCSVCHSVMDPMAAGFQNYDIGQPFSMLPFF